MTSNPFSIENLAPTWVVATEILKGDLPGHEFHGNQYMSIPSGGPMDDQQIKDHITALAAAGMASDSNVYQDNQRVNARNPVDIFGKRHSAPAGPEKARRINMLFQSKGQKMLDAMAKDPTLTVEKYASDLRRQANELLSKTRDDAPTKMAYLRQHNEGNNLNMFANYLDGLRTGSAEHPGSVGYKDYFKNPVGE